MRDANKRASPPRKKGRIRMARRRRKGVSVRQGEGGWARQRDFAPQDAKGGLLRYVGAVRLYGPNYGKKCEKGRERKRKECIVTFLRLV